MAGFIWFWRTLSLIVLHELEKKLRIIGGPIYYADATERWWDLNMQELGILLSAGLTVNFLHQGPLYVELGKTLILEARFQLQQGESIRLFAWDRKNGGEEIRLVTQNQIHVSRTSVGNNGQVLVVKGLTASDYGKYTVTVTDNNGDQVPKSIEVLEAKRPPDVSLSLKCIVTPQGALVEAPVFSWLVDGQKVSNESGKLSPDGSVLYLSNVLDRNYTCSIDSSQGKNNKEVKIPEPESKPESSSSNTGYIVAIVILVIGILVLSAVSIVLFLRLKRRSSH